MVTLWVRIDLYGNSVVYFVVHHHVGTQMGVLAKMVFLARKTQSVLVPNTFGRITLYISQCGISSIYCRHL